MAIVTTDINLTSLTYAEGEQIDIRNGATLTINTSTGNALGNVNVLSSGKLLISNNTINPIRVALSDMFKDMRFENTGELLIDGQNIQIGTGTGTSQAFNIQTIYPDIYDDLTLVLVEQTAGMNDYRPIPIIHIDPQLANIGRQDGGIPQSEITNGEVGRVAFWNQATKVLSFGDGTNGLSVPIGHKIAIPNIFIANNTSLDSSVAITLLMEGTPTAGAFQIRITNRRTNTVLGTTGSIAWNATATTIDANLETFLGANSMSTAGALPGGVTIVFGGIYSTTPLAFEVVNSTLSGGTNPVAYFRETTNGNLPIIDTNPSGKITAKNCMFSAKYRFSNSSSSNISFENVGFGGDLMDFNSTNADLILKNTSFVFNPFAVQGTLNINATLGNVEMDGFVYVARRSNSRLILTSALGLSKFKFIRAFCFASQSRLAGNRESLNFATVATDIEFEDVIAVGGRIVANNLVNNNWVGLKFADGHTNTQTTGAAVSSLQFVNCVNQKVLSPRMAGIQAPRNYFFTTDINCKDIQIYSADLNAQNNTQGFVNPANKGVKVYNSKFANLRGGSSIDLPATFLGSGIEAKKVFTTYATAQGNSTLDCNQDGIYNLVSSTILGINQTFTGVENYVGGNFTENSLTPTTGHITFGPFGQGTGLTLGGKAFTSQTGRINFLNALDQADIEIPFFMNGVTSFTGNIDIRGQLFGAISNSHTILNDGGISGGTFTISIFNNTNTLLGTTTPIAWNASTATIQTTIRAINALVNLTTVGGALTTGIGFTTSGSGGSYFCIAKVDGSLLTGGTKPNTLEVAGTLALITGQAVGFDTSVQFAIKPFGGTYGGWQNLTSSNLTSQTLPNVNDGFMMKLKIVNPVVTTFNNINQFSLGTNLSVNTVTIADTFFNIRGVAFDDYIELYQVENGSPTYITSFIGGGVKGIEIGTLEGKSFYFDRYLNDSITILMSTRAYPKELFIGNNGNIDLFAGAEIQLAEGSNLPRLVRLELRPDLNIINEGVQLASDFDEHTTDLPTI